MEKPTSPAVHDALRDKNRRNSILSTLEVESGDFAQTEDFEKAVRALRHFEMLKYNSELTEIVALFLMHWDQLSLEAQRAFV